MKARNDREEFVSWYVKENGYPRWDKATVKIKETASNFGATGINASGDTIAIIPIVGEGENFVKGFVSAQLTGNIFMDYFRGGDYTKYSFNNVPGDSINADKAAIEMMLLNKDVFNTKEFYINDNRLFSNENIFNPNAQIRKVKFQDSTESVEKLIVPTCITILLIGPEYTDVMIICTEGSGTNNGGSGGGTGGGDCSSPPWTWGGGGYPNGNTPNAPDPGGGTGGGTGGGGSFPCSTTQGKTIPPAPCNGAPPSGPVTPVQTGNPNSVVSPFTDSIPNILSRACDTKLDSVFNWALLPQNGFREQVFILVKKNGVIYPKNFMPRSEAGGGINYLKNPDEVLVGWVHTHPVETDPTGRSFFSFEDIQETRKFASLPNYCAIVECGNKRYAMVISDPAKMNAFFNGNGFARIKELKNDKLHELVLDMPNYNQNRQQASVDAVLGYFGSSSNCGITFYEANSPDKNNFIKLNP